MSGHLQLPNALFVLFLDRWIGCLGRSDHLSPPDGLLELHEALLVLVPLHQHPGHLHPGEPLPLGHGNLLLVIRLLLLPGLVRLFSGRL